MQSIYEIFEYHYPLNIRIFIHRADSFGLHWHPAHEFLMILEGKCSITVGETHNYSEDDLVLINAYTPHSLKADGKVVILALQVKDTVFGDNLYFNVDSSQNKKADYSTIKTIMARLIKLHSEHSAGYEILMQSLVQLLKYELVTRYQLDSEGSERLGLYRKHIAKLSGVLDYIRENYKNDIGLSDTAEKFYFSPAYLSRLFEKTMGITFKKYIDSVRFNDAMNLLFTTSKSIDEISEESGFANTRAFVTMHKRIYGTLPSANRQKSVSKKPEEDKNGYFIDLKKTDYLSHLARYLEGDHVGTATSYKQKTETVMSDISVNTAVPTGEMKYTFKNFCTVGRASDLLRENVREMVREAQKKIGFKYIKFHGIFDDALSVYNEDEKGRPVLCFDLCDRIFDFLLSVGLKPLVQLSFMPRALAKYPEKNIFYLPLCTSEPKSNKKWSDFVSSFVKHLLCRYGIVEVESWLFAVWNEAETPSSMFGFSDPSLFPEFFRVTYKAVKEQCETIKFGTTSTMSESIIEDDYFKSFLEQTADCPPDFINLHFYPIVSKPSSKINHLSSSNFELHSSPYIMKETIKSVKQKLKELNLDNLPVFLTEWNSTTSHRDMINDTAFKGAYVVRNILENLDSIDSFGYWSLTDDIWELPTNARLFHGGHGLFTKNGIKKPPFYAFEFLAQLGRKIVEKRKGLIVTEDERGFQLLFVNYVHYSDIYAAGEIFDMTDSNRYTAFREEQRKTCAVKLKNVVDGDYVEESYIVNKKNGSVFDVWCENCAPVEPESAAAISALENSSFPKFISSKSHVENGELTFTAILEPHEIRLVLIKRL